MTYITGYIRFFIMIVLCLNGGALLSSESFDPYSPSSTNSLGSNSKFSQLGRTVFSSVKNGGSVALLAFLDKSSAKMYEACDFTSKVFAENPKQVSAAAVAATVLAVAWYKRASIKEYCQSEKLEQFKAKINSLGASANTMIDNQIAKLPFMLQPFPAAVKGLIAWFYRKLIAMEGEYVIGAFMSPLIGYINSYTPFGALIGAKAGYAVAGGFLVRGWMGIDAAEIKREVKKVENKVDGVANQVGAVDEKIDKWQREAVKNHKEALKNIKALDGKIKQLSHDITLEIENSAKNLSEKVENSGEVLKKNIETVHNELLQLVEQVRKLPSKDDNQEIVNEAMKETIASFKECIASSVEALGQETKQEMKTINQQLKECLAEIDRQRDEAAKNHEVVLKNIQNLNDKINKLVPDINKEIEESNKNLSEKVDSSAHKAAEFCGVLKHNIGEVSKELSELVEQVKKLPSKDDVDKAMAKVIENFEKCITSGVEGLDKKTKDKFVSIDQQLEKGFQNIDSKQDDQAQEIKNLAEKVSSVIDEREQNIKALTDLVDSTKLSNKTLLEKFNKIEGGFIETQKAFKESDEKYSKLLEEKVKDWERLENIINKQISGFSSINEKLSELQNKIDTVDQKADAVEKKTDKQYEDLIVKVDEGSRKQEEALKFGMQQMQETCNNAIRSFREELLNAKAEAVKEREVAALREALYLETISRLEEAQKKQDEKVDALHEDLKGNGKKVDALRNELGDTAKKLNDNFQETAKAVIGALSEIKSQVNVALKITSSSEDSFIPKEKKQITSSSEDSFIPKEKKQNALKQALGSWWPRSENNLLKNQDDTTS